ncbi:hypothetical protein JJV70_21055 [Streptomyces sp. JJ66]|uniref:DUF7537 family lipoprotein n=1 Tax=Streptomyces sp. JJ66 TaxID=2803843 RepID=UPI001C586D14|nr:hypothetical protein [Streptomyces sp. JJ66]MBW1604545.1 hypothetical protein [Streptomyces sp. JJ66]
MFVRNRVGRTAALAVAGVVACVPLAACGSDDGAEGGDGKQSSEPAGGQQAGGDTEAVRAAYDTTSKEESATFTLKSVTEAGSEKVEASGEGMLDFASGESEMTITAEGTEIEQRVVDGVLYQKLPQDQTPASGKPWVKIDLAELAQTQGVNGGSQPNNPAATAEFAKAISEEDVKELGSEEIEGVNTTHYRVEIDVAELEQGEQLRKTLGEAIPMELWLDEDGLIRRQQLELTVRPPEGASQSASAAPDQATVRTVMTFSDFGTDISVEAPPEGETTDMTEEAGQQGQPEQQ